MGGRSERDFGRALRKHPRDQYLLQTKVRPSKDPRQFERALAASLAALEVEYLDLFAFHGINLPKHLAWVLGPSGDGRGGCLEVARRWQRAGKIRHVGFSTHAPTPLVLAAIATGAFACVFDARPRRAAPAHPFRPHSGSESIARIHTRAIYATPPCALSKVT